MSSSQHFSSHKHSYLLLRNDIIIQFNSPKWASQVRSMILGQVSWLDCFIFLVFLAPQLIIHVGFFPTLFCGLKALPFLGMLDTLFIWMFYSPSLDLIFVSPKHKLIPSSVELALNLHLRAVTSKSRTPLSVCSTSIMVWRYRNSMCKICFCVHSCEHWESVLFKMGGFAILEISHAETWIFSLPNSLAWGKQGKTIQSLRVFI